MAENFSQIDNRVFIEWKGIKVSYTYYENKRKDSLFILIGGWTSAPRYWDRNLNFFKNLGSVAILDLVGHYPSEIDPSIHSLSFDLFLEVQSHAILEISKNKKPILVGHSTGGMAVLGTAALFSDKIEKVISIAPVVYGPIIGLFKTAVLLHRIRMGVVFELGFSATQLSPAFLQQGFARGVAKPEEFFKKDGMIDYINNYFPHFKNLSGKNMNMILDMLDRTDLRPIMINYKTPTLLIRSLNDPIVPHTNSDHLAKDHPCIQEVLINSAGHFIHLEEQELFEEAVLNFLKKKNPKKKLAKKT